MHKAFVRTTQTKNNKILKPKPTYKIVGFKNKRSSCNLSKFASIQENNKLHQILNKSFPLN